MEEGDTPAMMKGTDLDQRSTEARQRESPSEDDRTAVRRLVVETLALLPMRTANRCCSRG